MRFLVCALALCAALLAPGCAKPLPPHVRLEIPRVEAADLFWWTDTQQCELRVFFWKTPDTPAGFTVPVDASLCKERFGR